MASPRNRNSLYYRFTPFLRWWPMVNRSTLRADFSAGLTGAIVVLPQGVAFAAIAGNQHPHTFVLVIGHFEQPA